MVDLLHIRIVSYILFPLASIVFGTKKMLKIFVKMNKLMDCKYLGLNSGRMDST